MINFFTKKLAVVYATNAKIFSVPVQADRQAEPETKTMMQWKPKLHKNKRNGWPQPDKNTHKEKMISKQ
jgi:hypothetical protein